MTLENNLKHRSSQPEEPAFDHTTQAGISLLVHKSSTKHRTYLFEMLGPALSWSTSGVKWRPETAEEKMRG